MIDFKNNTEVENLIQKINKGIKQELSEKRYNHSVGVMKKAEELAKIHGVDINKAKLVGLAHDIGKELSKEEKLEYAKNNNLDVDEIEKKNIGWSVNCHIYSNFIVYNSCKKRRKGSLVQQRFNIIWT